MRRTNIYVLAGALACSTMLVGCGNNDERMKNPMQEDHKPSTGSEQHARQTNQNTPGHQAGEGEMGGKQVDPTAVGSDIGGREMVPSQNIVQNITAAPNITTLASVIRKAEMVKTLNGTGPYTVFAPDNKSFEALPGGRMEDLMKEENKQQLVDILNSHIIAGKLTSDNLQDGAMLKTVGGQQLKVTKRGTDIMVNGAKVVMADNMSSNGVIHVIDKVLMPEGKK